MFKIYNLRLGLRDLLTVNNPRTLLHSCKTCTFLICSPTDPPSDTLLKKRQGSKVSTSCKEVWDLDLTGTQKGTDCIRHLHYDTLTTSDLYSPVRGRWKCGKLTTGRKRYIPSDRLSDLLLSCSLPLGSVRSSVGHGW